MDTVNVSDSDRGNRTETGPMGNTPCPKMKFLNNLKDHQPTNRCGRFGSGAVVLARQTGCQVLRALQLRAGIFGLRGPTSEAECRQSSCAPIALGLECSYPNHCMPTPHDMRSPARPATPRSRRPGTSSSDLFKALLAFPLQCVVYRRPLWVRSRSAHCGRRRPVSRGLRTRGLSPSPAVSSQYRSKLERPPQPHTLR